MRIAVTGASGFLGRPLVARLAGAGHEVVRLVRRAPRSADERAWDPVAGVLDRSALAGVEAAVHLAGAGLADGRWTAARRAAIRGSRVDSTRLLAETLAGLAPRPRVLISASAIGIYGDRGEEWLEESSAPGAGFLAGVAREWEAAAAPAAHAGIRVAHPRTGIVLAPHAGALAALLPLFRLGLGGRLGSGRQWWSWVALTDAVGAIVHALADDQVRGPFNLVAPAPVRCRAFASALGRSLRRPALLPAPAFALRAWLGRARADELLLASQRVLPSALARSGFEFTSPDLDDTLVRLLRSSPGK